MIKDTEVVSVQIDGDRYHDTRHARVETDHIWRKTWLLAALESDLQKPKSTVTFDIGHDSIIISRANDGALYAYHNACTHRGTRLLEEGVSSSPLTMWMNNFWTMNGPARLK